MPEGHRVGTGFAGGMRFRLLPYIDHRLLKCLLVGQGNGGLKQPGR